MRLGLVSLWCVVLVLGTPSARAEEPSAPQEAPVVVTLGGYLEAYYALNLRLPSNQLTNLRGFDHRDRTPTLANVALDARGERGPLTVRAILQVGATPSTYYLAEPARPGTAAVAGSDAELWKYVQQAIVTYRGPRGVVAEGGLVPSPIGPEVFAVKDNWNWSRSNLFFGLPFYHTGARVSVPLGRGWTGTAHVYGGWNSVVDNNATPSVALSAGFACGRTSGQVLYFGGIERGDAWRHLLDAYATVPLTGRISVGLHADGGLERVAGGTSGWLAGAAYGRVEVSPALHVAARVDGFREWSAPGQAAIFWPTSWLASATATIAYQPVAGLSLRLEARHDHAPTAVFFGGEVDGDGDAVPFVPNRRLQDTLVLGITAWF